MVEPTPIAIELRAALQGCAHHPVCAAQPCVSYILLPQSLALCLWKHLTRVQVPPKTSMDPTQVPPQLLLCRMWLLTTFGEGGITLVFMGGAGAQIKNPGETSGREVLPIPARGVLGRCWQLGLEGCRMARAAAYAGGVPEVDPAAFLAAEAFSPAVPICGCRFLPCQGIG